MQKMQKISVAILLLLTCLGFQLAAQTKTDHFLTTDDGARLFVKKSGKGAICIFIHGGPGAWSKSFEDLKGNNLEQHLSMVYYDQRGCGRSQKSPREDYSLDRMLKDIDLIRQHFKADKVYLLSHSFGGILAVNYALKYPEHVKGLILANSTLNLRYSLENQLSYMNTLMATHYTATGPSHEALMAAFMKAKHALSEKGWNYKMLSDHKKNVDLVQKIDDQSPSDYDFAKHVFQQEVYWQDYSQRTSEIKVPVLVITGAKDHAIGENHYTSFDFVNQQVEKINGGHLLYYENNPAFIKAIFDFVKN